MKRLYFFFLWIIPWAATAQNPGVPSNSGSLDEYLTKKFSMQSFLLGQFVERFNHEKILLPGEPGVPLNTLLLLNHQDTLLMSQARTTGFLDTFSSARNHRISLDKDLWYAEVTTSFIYKGKLTDIALSMKLDGNEQSGFSWIIFDVASDLFARPTFSQPSDFINPRNNDISFSELAKAFLNNTDMANFFPSQKPYAPLSSFRDYVKNGELTFSHIKNIRYVFIDIAGFNFTVDNFLRMNMNSGWLISTINPRP